MAPGFYLYDIAFLVLFTLGVVFFLYTRKHNLQRQGLLYLYRTKVGIKFIEWTSKKFPKTLRKLQYFVVASGYILMISMIYLLIKFSYFYLTSPIAAQALKVPVIVPLIPYLPEIFNLDFLPPFYFTYWILIIAIIAIPHEFAHGIFARLHKIKIHSTGFGFLGPFLAAFVEPDEKEMEKKNKFPQLAILASGTFANIVFALIFGIIFWLFFVSAFVPAGVIFNTYASSAIPVSSISKVNGIDISDMNEILNIINKSSDFTEVEVSLKSESGDSPRNSGGGHINLFIPTSSLITALENDIPGVNAYIDSPAFRAKLSGAITHIDGRPMKNFDELREIFKNYNPDDEMIISTIQKDGSERDYKIVLDEFGGKAFLGIGVYPIEGRGLLGWAYEFIAKIKDPNIYYESFLGDFGYFIYHLLWWTVLISLSVALVNMLPLGIFDGGRFFFLTVWGLTGSKLIGERAFKISTYLMLLLVAVLMVKWLFIFV